MPAVDLVPIDVPNLRRLAVAVPVDMPGVTLAEGGMSPRHVARMAADDLDAGVPPDGCLHLPVMPVSRDAVVGRCRFNSAPADGVVEISDGIAPAWRRQGVATSALALLIERALRADPVERVIAHVLSGNVASERLLQRFGFTLDRTFVDHDGDSVGRWCLGSPR